MDFLFELVSNSYKLLLPPSNKKSPESGHSRIAGDLLRGLMSSMGTDPPKCVGDARHEPVNRNGKNRARLPSRLHLSPEYIICQSQPHLESSAAKMKLAGNFHTTI